MEEVFDNVLENQEVNTRAHAYVMSQKDKLPRDLAVVQKLEEDLKRCDIQKIGTVEVLSLKNPIIALILGLFLGGFGADRFYIEDNLLGGIKLALYIVSIVFCVAFIYVGAVLILADVIWIFVDLFLTFKQCKINNLEKIRKYL